MFSVSLMFLQCTVVGSHGKEHIDSVAAVCVGCSVFVSAKVGGKFVGRFVGDFYVVLS